MFKHAPRRIAFMLTASLAAGLGGCAPAESPAPNPAVTQPPKVAAGITEKYWKLVELRGQPVPASHKDPHLILKVQDSRAHGSTGCNGFGGTYTLDEATMRISFGQIAMTQMFCAGSMETEKAFTEVLAQADNYSLNGDHMTLNRARMAPLARFEAVDQP